MTIISNSRKFIFVHLHKCGGTSVEQAYAQHATWNDLVLGSTPQGERLQNIYRKLHGLHKHNTALELKQIVGPEIWSQYWTVALVRHPLRIYESFYGWISKIVERYLEENKISRDQFVRQFHRKEIEKPFVTWGATRAYANSTSFSEFVDATLKRPLLPGSLASRLSESQNIIVDDVYKLEEIDQFWKEFESRSGRTFERLHANKSSRQEYPWDKAHLEEIHRRFEIDFRKFNYE